MRKLHVVEIARRERKREEGGRERVYLEWYSITKWGGDGERGFLGLSLTPKLVVIPKTF